MEGKQICSTCKVEKYVESFYFRDRSHTKRSKQCKGCKKKKMNAVRSYRYQSEYYRRNKARKLAAVKERRAAWTPEKRAAYNARERDRQRRLRQYLPPRTSAWRRKKREAMQPKISRHNLRLVRSVWSRLAPSDLQTPSD